MYEYKCKILRVVDGDTVDIDIDLGFGMWMHKERVRMMEKMTIIGSRTITHTNTYSHRQPQTTSI